MLVLMFVLGGIVIAAGLIYTEKDFIESLLSIEGRQIENNLYKGFDIRIFLTASTLLFSSFIGFDAIAQTGSEAKDPTKTVPRAILLSIFTVTIYYMVFTFSVYNIVPWNFIAEESLSKDITAPGLLSYILSPFWGTLIILGATIALINDLPAMILSVSRLMYSWAKDKIFPEKISAVHKNYNTPYKSIFIVGVVSSIGSIGSHYAGDFFLGIDIMVTAMMINFLLMCITVISIINVNPSLHKNIKIIKNRKIQKFIGFTGSFIITIFLIIHTYKDLTSNVKEWYFHSTYIYLIVMILASIYFLIRWKYLKNDKDIFNRLPNE